MFGFVTAFDWCSGGYDPFDGSQNGRSRHRATTPEAFGERMAEAALGPATGCQRRRQGCHPSDHGGSYGRPNYMDSHKNIIWKSIILPSVKEDTQ
jgi:hypothetical protein